MLYALNTGGAVLGCFAAGYVLIGTLGLYQTVGIGAALNLVIALLVWLLRRHANRSVPLAPAAAPATPSQPPRLYSATIVRLVLWGFALSGFAALSYEVLWTRALTFFMGNSTYAFSAMLTTFLCGLALGSLSVRSPERPPAFPAAIPGWTARGDWSLRPVHHSAAGPAVLWPRYLVGRL